jgi:hypothetical protein
LSAPTSFWLSIMSITSPGISRDGDEDDEAGENSVG